MLPSKGYLSAIPCVFYLDGKCERPHCHYRHCARDKAGAENAKATKTPDGTEDEWLIQLIKSVIGCVDKTIKINPAALQKFDRDTLIRLTLERHVAQLKRTLPPYYLTLIKALDSIKPNEVMKYSNNASDVRAGSEDIIDQSNKMINIGEIPSTSTSEDIQLLHAMTETIKEAVDMRIKNSMQQVRLLEDIRSLPSGSGDLPSYKPTPISELNKRHIPVMYAPERPHGAFRSDKGLETKHGTDFSKFGFFNSLHSTSKFTVNNIVKKDIISYSNASEVTNTSNPTLTIIDNKNDLDDKALEATSIGNDSNNSPSNKDGVTENINQTSNSENMDLQSVSISTDKHINTKLPSQHKKSYPKKVLEKTDSAYDKRDSKSSSKTIRTKDKTCKEKQPCLTKDEETNLKVAKRSHGSIPDQLIELSDDKKHGDEDHSILANDKFNILTEEHTRKKTSDQKDKIRVHKKHEDVKKLKSSDSSQSKETNASLKKSTDGNSSKHSSHSTQKEKDHPSHKDGDSSSHRKRKHSSHNKDSEHSSHKDTEHSSHKKKEHSHKEKPQSSHKERQHSSQKDGEHSSHKERGHLLQKEKGHSSHKAKKLPSHKNQEVVTHKELQDHSAFDEDHSYCREKPRKKTKQDDDVEKKPNLPSTSDESEFDVPDANTDALSISSDDSKSPHVSHKLEDDSLPSKKPRYSEKASQNTTLITNSDTRWTKAKEIIQRSVNGTGKVRIAHVPNVTNLLSAKNRIMAKALNTRPHVNSYQVPVSTPISSSSSNREDEPAPKLIKRVAHTGQAAQLKNPTVILSDQVRIPTTTRQLYCNSFCDEFKKFIPEDEARQLAATEELALAEKWFHLKVYKNSCTLHLLKIRKSKGRLNKDKEAVIKLKSGSVPDFTHGWTLYKCFAKYLTTEEDLVSNGFPLPLPGQEGCAYTEKSARKFYIQQPDKQSTKICSNCRKPYEIDEDGMPTTKDDCFYHWGKFIRYLSKGQYVEKFSCCDGSDDAQPCQTSTYHVWYGRNEDCMPGFIKTREYPSNLDENEAGIYAIDCEMCYTTRGLELARLTVIDLNEAVIFDEVVSLENPVLDYCTRFSGIDNDAINKATYSFKAVQKWVQNNIFDKTILIGHSLENDLKAMKVIHKNIVDTSIIFPHKFGPPRKSSLKVLARTILETTIQECESGHDSKEDALTCLKLMMMKIKEDAKVRKPKVIIGYVGKKR